MMRHFINLTNGIEHLQHFADTWAVAFIRIQSTTCEQKDWDRLILDLDNNLLMYLALGHDCHVWDYSTHRRPARAMRQGLELVRFMLEKYWLGNDYQAPTGQSTYFRTIQLSKPAENKLKYYRKFLCADSIRLTGHSETTIHDGDYEWYSREVRQRMSARERIVA